MTLAEPLADDRWQLYRLLSDPMRLRVLALAAREELSVGELSELLGQSQPNVSRYVAPLRRARLLTSRRQGTRTLVRLVADAQRDAVVADALEAAERLCGDDGSLGRIGAIIAARDAKTREFFDRAPRESRGALVADELPAYLFALGSLPGRRELAIDVGTGDGALLDVLAPLFTRVVAIERSATRLAEARQRALVRGYDHVECVRDRLGGEDSRQAVYPGGHLVMAARLLHHTPLPREAMTQLAALLAPGGLLVVVDYARHDDESLREQQADVWLGFEPAELEEHARACGLEEVSSVEIPQGYVRSPVDGHLPWFALRARRSHHSRLSPAQADGICTPSGSFDEP